MYNVISLICTILNMSVYFAHFYQHGVIGIMYNKISLISTVLYHLICMSDTTPLAWSEDDVLQHSHPIV